MVLAQNVSQDCSQRIDWGCSPSLSKVNENILKTNKTKQNKIYCEKVTINIRYEREEEDDQVKR